VLLALIYIASCLAIVAALMLRGAPDISSVVYGSAVLVALVGVPHGGLDHWTGRRLLASSFGERWWMMFFPGYLAVGALVALAWFVYPIPTVLGFFLLSAWHFGREEQHLCVASPLHEWRSPLWKHLSAIALGGLVIWVPAVVRTDELLSLLRMIVPSTGGDSGNGHVEQIAGWTKWIAMTMLPLGAVACIERTLVRGRRAAAWVSLATVGMTIIAPILVSFTAYFCFWHSLLGLSRLRAEEGLTPREFVLATLPLSALAVVVVISVGSVLWHSFGDLSFGAIPASVQTLFIGLSAIAVPHLLLHEWSDRARRRIVPLELQP